MIFTGCFSWAAIFFTENENRHNQGLDTRLSNEQSRRQLPFTTSKCGEMKAPLGILCQLVLHKSKKKVIISNKTTRVYDESSTTLIHGHCNFQLFHAD